MIAHHVEALQSQQEQCLAIRACAAQACHREAAACAMLPAT
jgi:hypothetical protein